MQLLALYAGNDDEGGFFRTADSYFERCEGRYGIADVLVNIIVTSVKAGETLDPESWLLRAEGWATRVGDSTAKFSAWGQRGLFVERSGEIERAVSIYESAIKAGSTDRTTFTRLLMIYEKRKVWTELLSLAQVALGLQRDASWEEDLQKRIARVKAKQEGRSSREAIGTVKPFSFRQGNDGLNYVGQLSFKHSTAYLAKAHQSNHLLLSFGTASGHNVALVDLDSGQTVWAIQVRGSSASVHSSTNGFFLVASDLGRIGEGSAELLFLQQNGHELGRSILPDKLSQVRLAKDTVYVGCRDGHLYAYDSIGNLRWKFLVPESAVFSEGLDPFYQRSCPYFIEVSESGEAVLLSSWDRVFQLDSNGRLRWNWQAAVPEIEMQFKVPSTVDTTPIESFRILGLDANAPPDDVRRAFRRRAMETHPDRNPTDPKAASKFREAVKAYETITSRMERSGVPNEFATISMTMTGPRTTVYGLATSRNGAVSLVSCSDGGLNALDHQGRLLKRHLATEGPGYIAATPDLERVVYSHWQGFNFYDTHGLISLYEDDRLHQLKMSDTGAFVAAWQGKSLVLFSSFGHLISEIEFSKTVRDVAFIGKSEFVVSAGKLIRFQIG
ncbi:hypothetical protein BH23CHL5_BH23CHL5_18790 [soil metagenome]